MLRRLFSTSLIALCGALAAFPAAAQVADAPALTGAQALDSDAHSYARAYGVPLEEAKRRMLLMATSGEEIGRLEAEVAGTLSGAYFDHQGTFALVVRLVGGTLPANRTLTVDTGRPELGAPQLELPVRFEAASGVTRAQARAILSSKRELLRSLFPKLQGFGYDERSGELSILVQGAATEASLYDAQKAQLTQQLGMPFRIEVAPVTVAPRAMRGGAPLYLADNSPWCTTAFVAKNAAGQTGLITAGHCDEAQYWHEGTSASALTQTNHFDGWADFAFMRGSVATVPEFYGNRNEAARVLHGRRTKDSTVARTGTTAGSYICDYGRVTGPAHGQTCGEVTDTYFNPNYASPGCSNGPTFVACEANFVEIRARGTEVIYCFGGDSGAPVFTFDVAWGILSGCGIYSGTDQAYNLVYTSTDELYFNNYTLTYGP